jgi:phosphoglycolate phosphatase-like HAD superfamily hydrolase
MLEQLRPGATAERARIGLFDFDGTISTIRSGWIDVMVPMMVETLVDLKTGEPEQDLEAMVREYVGQLTGRQTMYQMIEFADQITKRGGVAKDPLEYKRMYLDLLWERIKGRIDDLKEGRCSPEKYLVPGSIELLDALRDRGLKMYLASGTDEVYMKEEARLLGVTKYFDGGVFGALDDYKSFSKGILVERIISSSEASGDEFLGFGDGYVEIEVVKKVGGIAIGVASDEPDCLKVDVWKRNRLAGVGADYIVPNFLVREQLFAALFPSTK